MVWSGRNRLFAGIAVTVFAIAATQIHGNHAAARYKFTPCPYHLNYENEGDIDLLSIGGSRIFTALDADDLADKLKAEDGKERAIYNAAHSIYNIEKEYTIFRDFAENRTIDTAIIEYRPREFSTLWPKDVRSSPSIDLESPKLHYDYYEIAPWRDMPLAFMALAKDSIFAAVKETGKVFIDKLKIKNTLNSCKSDKPGKRCNDFVEDQTPVRNCHAGDYRPKADVLLAGLKKGLAIEMRKIDWDFSNKADKFSATYVEAFRKTAHKNNIALFFMYLNRTTDPLPTPQAVTAFEKRFGVPLLVMPDDLAVQLAKMGTRDTTHIYKPGREIFLPWFIKAVRDKCPPDRDCL